MDINQKLKKRRELIERQKSYQRTKIIRQYKQQIANDNDFVLDSTGNDVIKANKITSGEGDDTLIGVADDPQSTVGADLKSHFGRDQIIRVIVADHSCFKSLH